MPIYLEILNFQGKEKATIAVETAQPEQHRVTGTGVGRTAARTPERPDITEVVVTKKKDDYSQGIVMDWLSGETRTMAIHFYDGKKNTKYMTWKLKSAFISGYRVGAVDASLESLSLSFAKIEYEYDAGYLKDQAGNRGWDLSKP